MDITIFAPKLSAIKSMQIQKIALKINNANKILDKTNICLKCENSPNTKNDKTKIYYCRGKMCKN